MSDGITIDNLRINVESNASAASGAIQGFVDDLEKLKSAVARNNAAKNLTSLADSLKGFSDVSNPTNKLAGLATELEKLKNIGSVRTVANSLNSITETLGRLKGVSDDQITVAASAITRIAEAMRSFDGMKISGVSTTIKSLGEIGTVTEKLSDETLAKFESKVKRVSEILTPLTTKATSLSSALRTIDSSAKTASTGIEKVTGVAERQALTLASLVGAWYGIRRVYNIISRMISKAVEDAVEWDGVTQRFIRGFGENAETAYAWIERLNEEMGLNKQQFMQYTSIYAQMLEGLGVVTEDAYKMALGYSELTYDIWAGYNDVFKKYEDAAQAIQSAISGNTRAIRRAGFSVLNTTLAQTAANHGLEISISGATEAEKSYLRYLALVDQAHQTNIIGTYAQEMNTAEGALRTLAQETKSFGQALGSLFIPLLQGAIPVLTAVVQLASDAVHYIASLFGIQIQTIDWDASRYTAGVADYADELDDVADAYGAASGAAEKYKRTILGIDEINPLNAKNAGGGGGGGGGGSAADSGITDWGLESVWTDAIFDRINSNVAEIKAKIQEYIPLLETIGTIIGAISFAALINSIGTSLAGASALYQVIGSIATLALNVGLNFVFAENYTETGNFGYMLAELLTTAASGWIMFKVAGTGGLTASLALSVVGQIAGMSAAIKEGADFNWAQAIVTALIGTGAGVAFGITLGLGPTGIIVSAAVALAITVGAIAVTAWQANEQRMMQEALAEKFGNIEYTAEQIKLFAEEIQLYGLNDEQRENMIHLNDTLTLFANAKINLESAVFNLEGSSQDMDSMFYSLNIGINVDQGEFDSTMSTFLDDAQNYLDQNYLTTKLAINVFGMEGTSLDSSADILYESVTTQLQELGTQLHEVVASAFEEGEWIPDKLEQAKKIYLEIQEILDMMSDYEYTAKLEMIKFDLGDDYSYESFLAGVEAAVQAGQEKINSLDDARYQLIIAAQIQLTQDKENGVANAEEIYAETVRQINETYANQKMEVHAGTIQFLIDQVSVRYPEIANDPSNVLGEAGGALNANGAFDPTTSLQYAIGQSMVQLSKAIETEYPEKLRESMGKLVEAIMPTVEEQEKLAAEAFAMGATVPEEIKNALNDAERLSALSGNANAINYMLGQQLTQSDGFTTMLATCEERFKDVPDAVGRGILMNLDFVTDSATGLIIGVKDSVTGEVQLLTPTMEANLQALGMDLGNALGSQYQYIYDKSTGLVVGIENAVTGEITAITDPVTQSASGLGTNLMNGFTYPIEQEQQKGTIPELLGNVIKGALQVMEGIVSSDNPFGEIGVDIMSALTAPFKTGSSTFNTLKQTLATLGSSIVTSLSNAFGSDTLISIGSSIISNITSGMKGLDLPNFHIDWTQAYKEFTVLGKTMKMYIPWPNISFYAQGGFPNAGELFMARESGNEFVGRVGNKSAVANNDQIVEAIARGVADAMQQGNSLLQEQNGLLREMGRNTGGGGYITAGSIVNGLNQKNRRDGRSVVVLGV